MMKKLGLIVIPICFVGSLVALLIFAFEKEIEKEEVEGKQAKIEAKQARPMVISGITRVFMHEPGRYTFFVKQSGNRVGQLTVAWVDPVRVDILEDLSEKEAIRTEIVCGWWSLQRDRSRTCESIPEGFSSWRIHSASRLTIHLHSSRLFVYNKIDD